MANDMKKYYPPIDHVGYPRPLPWESMKITISKEDEMSDNTTKLDGLECFYDIFLDRVSGGHKFRYPTSLTEQTAEELIKRIDRLIELLNTK